MPLGHNTDPGQAWDGDVLGRDSGILPCPTCLGFVFLGFFSFLKKLDLKNNLYLVITDQETLWDQVPKEPGNMVL